MSQFSVLMVAEKPSICTSVAEALYGMYNRGAGRLQSKGRSPPVYEFNGQFMGKPAFFRVTSVTGHIYSLDFPSKYQSWDAVDPMDLFSAPTVHNTEGRGGGIAKHLQHEAKGMDALVLWMDCDREGENICFEVIRTISGPMKMKFNPAKSTTVPSNVYRAKFSAVTAKDIEKAMLNLVSPNENESLSVDARQELDLKVGVAFSRFQTKYFQGKYGNLDSSIISYGPCQTPTLGFCVQRHDEIQSFVSEQFWYLDVSIDVPYADTSRKVALEWERGRIFDQSITETFAAMVNQESYLLCYDVKTSETRRTKPEPLNTVELLKLASKSLGIGPHAAMRAAEYLYLSGYLSYPRTESTAYPKSYDIREALAIQRDHPDWGSYARNLLTKGYATPRQGHDAGDHPPITPVGLATDLSGDNLRIYELVTRHFLATVSTDAIYLQTKAKFRVANTSTTTPGTPPPEEFVLIGKREIDPGFLEVYGESRGDGLSEIPEFKKDQRYHINSVHIRSGQTSAPGYLTESELIGLMEKHGIGTDASIPTHINNIMTRNYVALGNGRTLVPTDLGVVLVHGYIRIDPDLVLPDVRAAIESFCNLIAKGTASKELVVRQSLSNFMKKFEHFRQNIGAMDSLFEASFSPLAATGKALCKCGKCNRYMRYIPLKPQRLYCPTCEETYALPQNGTIKLYKELKCPLDQFDLVLFSLGNTEKAQGKSYPLCPYCYNHPPSFEDLENADATKPMKKKAADDDDDDEEGDGEGDDDSTGTPIVHGNMGCNSCLHPSCKHSLIQNGICQCPGTSGNEGIPCEGTLVLDVNSKPNWKLGCNQCNTLIRFKADIHNITPQVRKDCSECGVKLMNFEFNKLKSPLPNGETSYSGCIVCDDFLNGLSDIVAGRSMNIQVLRQLRQRRAAAGGRGKRGRGRGGRGRGRGKKGDVLMSFSDF